MMNFKEFEVLDFNVLWCLMLSALKFSVIRGI